MELDIDALIGFITNPNIKIISLPKHTKASELYVEMVFDFQKTNLSGVHTFPIGIVVLAL